MPAGIIATIEDGFATLDFVDKTLKGNALQRLIDIGGPRSIDIDTHSGRRYLYRVAEGNAREAGLLDGALPYDKGGVLPPGIAGPIPGSVRPAAPSNRPTAEWTFAALKKHATGLGKDPSALRSKAAVLDLINEENL
jgi:hypothetical protein